MGIVVVWGSKAGAHYAILEKISSSSIVTQRHFCGGQGVMFMRKIYPNSKLIGTISQKIHIGSVVLLLLREEKLYALSEIGAFAQGDILLAFGDIENKEEIQQWIYTL